MKIKKPLLSILLLLLPILFSGCKVDLYSNRTEKEANEMLAILLKHGLDGDKAPGKEEAWTLRVDKSDLAAAVDLLQDAGYPRDRYVSIGDIFKKEGLVSSPMEERIRFIYALSQEISETLSHIDGILTARVHIVIPENNPYTDEVKPSSASVFLKYKSDSEVEGNIPAIKKLVINSIEGLSYDKVSVFPFPSWSTLSQPRKPDFERFFFIKVAPESVLSLYVMTGGLVFLCAAAITGAGLMFRLQRRKAGTV